MQYASRLIPFFNAQIQGLNVLYKAATGKATAQEKLDIQNKFWNRAMFLAATMIPYAMAMDDDDVYKNARPSDRYNNWFIPLSRGPKPEDNVTIKLPIPFEVGVLFKALPEALADAMSGEFTEQHWKAIRNMFLQQIPGGSSYGIPQAVKPVLEVATNHSFFTQRPIESPGMEKLAPQERYTARTTELAKRMSELLQAKALPDFAKLSPPEIETLARGYFGSLPLMAAAATNELFGDPNKSTPDRKLSETPLLGGIFQDRHGGGAMDILYAKIKAADQAKATVDKMKREGRVQDAKMYMQDVDNLKTIPMLKKAEGELQELSAKERAAQANTTDTAERKRELLNAIAQKRETISRRYLDAVSAVSR